MNKTILITICARGGSKGIPGKNIKSINGHPLIWYTIQVAQQFQSRIPNVDIVLSTDSEEIKEVTKLCGLESDYKRPMALANDTCGKIDAIKDVLIFCEQSKGCRYDYVLDLDVTSPLRNTEDLIDAFKVIEQQEQAIVLYSVSPAKKNPYFNMVERKANGFYNLVKKRDLALSRQAAPKVYELNASFYYYRRIFFERGYKSIDTENSIIYLVPHMCFDLDEPIDFEFMEFLMANKKLDFIL